MTRLFNHWFSADKKLSAALKNILGFYPANIALYQMALRHKSLSYGKEAKVITNNERLEFLGDSILNAVVADHLFGLFPYKNEGFLTKMRSKIVSRHHLNSIALKMGLQNMLSREGEYSTGTSIYGNALEALIGSVYLDKGFTVVKGFILNRLFGIYINMDELENTEMDFKSKLTEWAQKEKMSLEFKVLNESFDGKRKNFLVGIFINNTLQGEAFHYSKKRAEQMAAEKTWNELRIKNYNEN